MALITTDFIKQKYNDTIDARDAYLDDSTDTGVKSKAQVAGLRKVSAKNKSLVFFPDDIMGENFTNKRLYISIYESKTLGDMVNQLKNTTKKFKDSVAKDIKEGSVSNTSSMLSEIADFKGKEKLIIALPLPNELSDTQSHGFSTDTGIVSDIASTINSVLPIDAMGAIGKVSSLLSTQRVLANPGYFQNYTGSEPREFSFSFKMMPNSSSEARKIIKIIKLLKKYSSPSLTAGSIMVAPHFFHFWFSNYTLQDLSGIRPCIISSVATNYSGSGILETTMDGMPKQIDIAITIKELRTITKDKWSV